MLEGFNVFFDPNKSVAYASEILVGLGNTKIENEGLVLQHKTQDKRYESLSQYVFERDIDVSAEVNSFTSIYIEDFSVDTVFGIWLFFSRRNKEMIPENIDLWLIYTNRWEAGDTSTTGKPFESYGCLQNALALKMCNQSPKEILRTSLFFLDYLIKNNFDPAYIADTIEIPQYLEARSTLNNEYEKYKDIVNRSEVGIFYMPNSDSKIKTKVSGIFIETNLVTSIQKVFLRNDEKSPTEDGYAFMAIYNPFVKGSGNDIVISVDPVKHIHLKALWKEIEKEEELLWNEERPKDNSRPLVSYPNNNGPNEPWWDDMGNYTLIAAPKMVGDEYGRRLSWKRVKQLIKLLYAKGAQS